MNTPVFPQHSLDDSICALYCLLEFMQNSAVPDVCTGMTAITAVSTSNTATLISDCNALMAAKSSIAMNNALSTWNTNTSMMSWRGIRVGTTDTYSYVSNLEISNDVYGGWADMGSRIPYQLGTLSSLMTLDLSTNQLTNSIAGPPAQALPLQLDALSDTLRTLNLGSNTQLTGCIPSGLWSMVTVSDTASLGECASAVDAPTSTPTQTHTLTPTPTLTLTPTSTATVAPTATPPSTPQTDGSGPGPGGGSGGGGGGSTQRPTCTNGTVVPNPSANATLVADCVLLLTNKEALEGSISTSSRLNWSETSGINTWEGVTIGGTPQRVTRLELDISGKTLAGSIPTTLSRLTGLQVLDISNNEFSGRIPVGLRALASLQVLDFSNNRLSGSMPTDLGSIATLQTLHLANNSLTGSIPTTLVDLSNLTSLSLAGNRFSGCIPNALARVAQNDLSDIELSFCDPVPPTATPTVTPTATATPLAPVGQDLFLPLVRK